MSGQLQVLTNLLVGSIGELEAARQLQVPVHEVQRLRCMVAGSELELMPVAVDFAARQVQLVDLRGASYDEPFLHDTVERARREHGEVLDLAVGFEAFVRAAAQHTQDPDGLIFHVGRCGSTLLANMLTASSEHLLLKEPDVINHLLAGWLHATERGARDEAERLLQSCTRYLAGAPRVATRARYRVLKHAAWNVCLAELMARVFPRTPMVFLLRSPVQTVASLLAQRPGWFALTQQPRAVQTRFFPSLASLGDDQSLTPVTLFAHAFRSALDAALTIPRERMLFVDYDSLVHAPQRCLTRVLAHLNHPLPSERVAAMVEARSIYSKDLTRKASFNPVGEHQRTPLSAQEAGEVWRVIGDAWEHAQARVRESAE